jgi:hypothetical protein
VQNVSAFLTGHKYGGLASSPDHDDDDRSSGENLTDNQWDNKFSRYKVFDPTDNYNTGGYDETYPKADRLNDGYNDLQMRKQRLCQLLKTDCRGRGSLILDLVQSITFVPLPRGGH